MVCCFFLWQLSMDLLPELYINIRSLHDTLTQIKRQNLLLDTCFTMPSTALYMPCMNMYDINFHVHAYVIILECLRLG